MPFEERPPRPHPIRSHTWVAFPASGTHAGPHLLCMQLVQVMAADLFFLTSSFLKHIVRSQSPLLAKGFPSRSRCLIILLFRLLLGLESWNGCMMFFFPIR